MMRATASGACRDCAQMGFGGPLENRYTAFDTLCRGAACVNQGYPQVSVNLANLTLYVRVTDLALGSPTGLFRLERSYNSDNQQAGPFGVGWTFSLGDRLTSDNDGTMTLQRGSGQTDIFAPAFSGASYFAVTSTSDVLSAASSGGFTLSSPGTGAVRVFNAAGLLTAILNNGAAVVSLAYDGNGNLTGANYRGRAMTFSNDGQGHISGFSDATGRGVSFAYTGDGHLAQQTNPDGSTVGYQYDGSGNLTGIAYGGGTLAVGWFSDPPFTSVASVTTADGAVRKYAAPLSPTQIQVTDGGGTVTQYTSSASGLLMAVTDAYDSTLTYGYDSLGRRTSATDALGDTETFTYDANNNLTSAVDGAGNRWAATYTAAGVSSIADPRGNTYSFAYDGSGNLLSVTDPLTGGWTATRTANGQIATLSNALSGKTSYQYGTDGLLSTFTDALGGNWMYQYDSSARVAARTDPSGVSLAATYGAGVQPAAIANGPAQLTYDFSGQQRDALNRLVQYADSFGNRMSYTYNGSGLLASMTLPGGNNVTYTYDQANRLNKVTDWLGNTAVYSYDAAGDPLSVTIAGGPIAIYQYDAARRLRAIMSTGPNGSPVAGYRYTLDSAGNRTQVSALEPVASLPPLAQYSITFNAANLPLSRTDGQTYQYDARGLLTAIQGPNAATLTYDPFGRLIGFNGSAATAYGYDSEGLRASVSGARYVYDLSGAQPRVVAQMDGSNNPVAWYIYGLGLLWQVTANGAAYYYHFDGDGNVVAMSNSSAGVVNTYRYDPLGRLTAANEGVANPFHSRGAAGWVDDGDGLVFTGAQFVFPDLRLTLPAQVDLNPPAPGLTPQLKGLGACFVQNVAACSFSAGGNQ